MINTIQTVFFTLLGIGIIFGFFFSVYRERFLIKTVFSDIILLYRNFIHWNISKLLIGLFAGILGVLLSLPFLILFGLSIYLLNIDILDTLNILNFITKYGFSSIIPFLLLIFMVIIFLFSISYYKVLLMNLSLKYLDGEKLPFMQNIYFNFNKIYKYFGILLWKGIYLLLPISIYLVLFFITFLLFGGSSILNPNGSINNAFSIISVLLTAIFGLWSLYLIYRMYFSYSILCDEKEDNNAKYYVKKSMDLTKGFNIFSKFIIINLFFLLVLSPFIFVGESLKNTQTEISKYLDYKKSQDNTSFQESQILDLKYGKYSEAEFQNIRSENNRFNIIYYIFSFIFIYGVMEMVLVSFYKKELIKDNNEISKLDLLKKFISSIFRRNKEKEEV